MDIEDDDSDYSSMGKRDEKSSAAATSVYRQYPLKRQTRSNAICILDYEEDDVEVWIVMDLGAALEQLYEVDEKLKNTSLPKTGRQKVYKLVARDQQGSQETTEMESEKALGIGQPARGRKEENTERFCCSGIRDQKI